MERAERNHYVLIAAGLGKTFTAGRPLHKWVLSPFATPRRVVALTDVSFRLRAGSILGIVGPNGAGKTTLLRILADLLEADRGSVTICGERLALHRPHLRGMIGYVSSDERSFFWRLSGRQNLKFFACLYGVPRGAAARKIDILLEKVQLSHKAEDLFRDYSAGMRKKLALARAMLHEPIVLLLDEVTNSLDPPSAQNIKSMVRKYVSAGPVRAAMWSTHRLEELDELCDDVLLMDGGHLKYAGAASGLLERMQDGAAGHHADPASSGHPWIRETAVG
jgi:ABC-2 type transport system ATP-binding protein